eukprot:6427562-Pyramimonas_sp.AAC.1
MEGGITSPVQLLMVVILADPSMTGTESGSPTSSSSSFDFDQPRQFFSSLRPSIHPLGLSIHPLGLSIHLLRPSTHPLGPSIHVPAATPLQRPSPEHLSARGTLAIRAMRRKHKRVGNRANV